MLWLMGLNEEEEEGRECGMLRTTNDEKMLFNVVKSEEITKSQAQNGDN
jgi:hypothetical protein